MNKKKVLLKMELLLIELLFVFLSPVLCIVGRDLVLTPRQGLQLSGKSIFYEEDSNEVLRNQTVHPWERTLKHVTFVTLFTDAAASAVAGNISKLKEYTDFLESPYISKENANPIRFGDIVMLANGRLEQAGNHTFRFIEGTCGYDCAPERVWALWQVQKIRHRDQSQNFRYEMKFSVSPLRTEAQLNELHREAQNEEEVQQPHGDMYVRRNALKTYIQREDDYPQSFGRIIYPEEIAFAQKRQDEDYMGRNFRHANDYAQVTPLTPLPQSTFMHGVYQAHPGLPPPPPPQRLNIGEYVKGFIHPKATPKIEVFPNLYNLMNRNNFPTPTTFRPNYEIKLARPDIYKAPPEVVRFPENRNELNFVGRNKLNTPLVTHHFHHHFFMPGSGENGVNNSGENHINSAEQQETLAAAVPARYGQLNRQVTPNYYNNIGRNNGGYYEAATTPRQESNLLPAPHKISFPLINIGENIVEVTPPPLSKRPQIYSVYPNNQDGKIPVLVYTASTPTTATTTSKPFIKSEALGATIRYSEPDPLYAHNGQSGTQVESPYFNTASGTDKNQVQPKDSTQKEQDESQQEPDGPKTDQILNHSQKELQISPEDETESTFKVEETQARRAASAHVVSTTSTTTNNPIISPPRHVTTPIPSTTETPTIRIFTQNSQIVSSSTTETPLHAVSRIRNGRPNTTTTDATPTKWKPKRRNQHSNRKFSTQLSRNKDNKSKNSKRSEEIVLPSLNSVDDTKNLNASTIKSQPEDGEVLEVLTQKSVSKSISIKVGNNGEEFPVINDVSENEVKSV